MTKSYEDAVNEDMRLYILRFLAADSDYAMGHYLLMTALKTVGHSIPEHKLRAEMGWLGDIGLIKIEETPEMLLASLTPRGAEVAHGVARVDGIRPPRPGE